MGALIVHENFARLATRLIKANGRTIHLVTRVDSPEPWNPEASSETLIPIVGMNLTFKLTEVDGDLVKHTDKRFLVDSSVLITEQMNLRDDDGVTYKLVDLGHLRLGETSILYKLQARR